MFKTSTFANTQVPQHRPQGHWRAAIGLALFTILGIGLLYSLIATAITGLLFPYQATGSLIKDNGKIVGSALVAQPFKDLRYFQPRPSGVIMTQ